MSDTKVIAKKNDVTCWNCFTTEDQDKLSDIEDDIYQPVALPKVREEHREKFKVYSFLASELAKPKAVPFKQTVSKHCTIAKKIDQKFVEQLTKDTEDMNLDCGENTPEEPLNKNFKPNPENIVQTTDTDNEDLDDSNKVLDLQDVEITTSRDITHGNILENTTECSKLTITENVASPELNKTIQGNLDCKHELSNDTKIAALELALPAIITGSTELSTPLQLQEEISFIASQKDPALKEHGLQSGITIVSDNIESTISSDLAIDIKSTDSIDSNYCAEDMKYSNVLPEVNCENSKTNSITKLPILKQNINSRYSPLFKLKKSPSTDKSTVPHDRIDIIYKSLSETVPIVCRKNYKEMDTKVDPKTTESASLSNIESKPLTPFSKKKTEPKSIPLLPNQRKTKCSSAEVSPIKKGSYFSKSSTVTSKSLPSATPPTLRKTMQKEQITSSKSPIAKIHTIISTEKLSILKRKSTEPKSPNSTDRSYCSESTEDVNLSHGVHPSKYSKNDIGTKLPVLKQNLNSKYSPLHKLKIGISKDKIVSNKDDTKINTSLQSESGRPEHGKKSDETTSEIKNLSDSNDSTSDIQFVSSTPKDKEIDNKSDASDETHKSSITKSLYSLAESTAESEVHNVDECKNIDKSEIQKCTSNEKVEKEMNIDVPSDKKFLKPRSISTEELGKKICPKLRRSTLSVDPRALNFTDEMYISEESPGHATLPRRSNSPLPHDRDLDRERFPLNRSGLQTRSESMASVYSGAGEGVRGGVPVRGEVQFSLVYNYRLGALEVGVKRCRDLAPIDVKKNRSDPYVKVYLLPDKSKTGKRKTKVKKNTLNPVFEETLSFQSSLESLSTRALWLSAWHADMFGRNDFLGEVTLPLAGRVFDDPAPSWHALGERSECPEESSGFRGDLIVGLKFELEPRASTGTLHVLVKEARRLVPSRAGALADVFCKSYLLPERGRLHKQKTPVCRRTLAPVWRAGLQYTRVAPQGLAERALELTLWDRDRLASNEFLGAVRLSRGTGMYRGESVNWMDSTGKEVSLWETMLQQPNFWVEGSLPLRPHLNN